MMGILIRPCMGTISSGYGRRRHPITGEISGHSGVDIAPRDKSKPVNILSSADGVVKRRYADGTFGTYGNCLIITHNINGKQYETLYAHLHSFNVKQGDRVKKGQIVGLMGNTGRSTGRHSHFEVHSPSWINTYANEKNPLDYITQADVMQFGYTGLDVKDLQEKFILCGYKLTADGEFGASTDKALRDWQAKNKLVADGFAGTETLSKLKEVISKQKLPPKGSEIRMFSPSSATLKKAVEDDFKQAVKDKLIDNKWLVQLQQGKLSLDDAFALRVIIEQRRSK